MQFVMNCLKSTEMSIQCVWGIDLFSPPLDEVWLSKPESQDGRERMQAQCHWHEEHQYILAHHSSAPMPTTSPDIAADSDDDSSVDSSPHDKISVSEGRIFLDHPNIANNYTHDFDPVGPNVVEPSPDP